MKPSYFILIFGVIALYLGWFLNLAKFPTYVSNEVSSLLITVDLILSILPGIFCSLIIFPIFRNRSKNTKVNITVLLLFSLLFAFGNLSMFGMQYLENFFLTLFLGFLGIKLIERNIERFYAKET